MHRPAISSNSGQKWGAAWAELRPILTGSGQPKFGGRVVQIRSVRARIWANTGARTGSGPPTPASRKWAPMTPIFVHIRALSAPVSERSFERSALLALHFVAFRCDPTVESVRVFTRAATPPTLAQGGWAPLRDGSRALLATSQILGGRGGRGEGLTRLGAAQMHIFGGQDMSAIPMGVWPESKEAHFLAEVGQGVSPGEPAMPHLSATAAFVCCSVGPASMNFGCSWPRRPGRRAMPTEDRVEVCACRDAACRNDSALGRPSSEDLPPRPAPQNLGAALRSPIMAQQERGHAGVFACLRFLRCRRRGPALVLGRIFWG